MTTAHIYKTVTTRGRKSDPIFVATVSIPADEAFIRNYKPSASVPSAIGAIVGKLSKD